jgi:hypothetical protein
MGHPVYSSSLAQSSFIEAPFQWEVVHRVKDQRIRVFDPIQLPHHYTTASPHYRYTTGIATPLLLHRNAALRSRVYRSFN